MGQIEAELQPLRAWHEQERARVAKMQLLRREMEQTTRDIATLERRFKIDRVAELKYEVLPNLCV